MDTTKWVHSLASCGCALSILATLAQAQPALSPKIALDHGVRYHNPDDWTAGTALAVLGDQVAFTYGHDFGDVYGYRRTAMGEPVDLEPSVLGPRWQDDYSRDHDLSEFDSIGWKLVFVTGAQDAGTGLYVRNIDPTEFTSTDELTLAPEGAQRIYHPEICFDGNRDIVVWAELSGGDWELRLSRVSPELELLGGGGMTVATGLSDGALGLAANEDGGMLGYVTADRTVMAQPLGADGLPIGVPVPVGAADNIVGLPPSLALTTFGEGYLLVWQNPSHQIAYALLDTGGSVQGAIHVVEGNTYFGIAACEGDHGALIAFIYVSMLRAVRIDEDGEVAGEPYSYFQVYQDYYGNRTNHVDCIWTGGQYIVAWNSHLALGAAPLEVPGDTRPSWVPESALFAQWLTADGEPVFDEPVDITSGSDIEDATAGYADGVFRSVLVDKYSEDFHTVGFDGAGDPVGDPFVRYWLFEESPPPVTRPATDFSDSIVHATAWATRREWDSPFPPRNEVEVGVLLNDVDGNLLHWTGERLCDECSAHVTAVDVAAARDSILLVHDYAIWGQPTVIHARLYSGLGRVRTWTIDSPYAQNDPTVVPQPGRYLMAWRDGDVGAEQIQTAWIDPQNPSPVIVGSPLFPQAGTQALPWLAVGADQILCVWKANLPGSPTGEDIYATRLDLEGNPIDPEPIAVGLTPGVDSYPRAIWDGEDWVVSWRHGYWTGGVYINQITESGEVVYPEATYVGGPAGEDIPALASDGHGTTLINLGGRWIRFLYGSTSNVGPDSVLEPAPFQVSAVWPNPSRGIVSLRLGGEIPQGTNSQIVDVSGRIVREIGPVRSPSVIWDGRLANGTPAPGGIYFFRVRSGSGEIARRIVRIR